MQVMGWGKGVGSIESAWKTRAFMFFFLFLFIIVISIGPFSSSPIINKVYSGPFSCIYFSVCVSYVAFRVTWCYWKNRRARVHSLCHTRNTGRWTSCSWWRLRRTAWSAAGFWKGPHAILPYCLMLEPIAEKWENGMPLEYKSCRPFFFHWKTRLRFHVIIVLY